MNDHQHRQTQAEKTARRFRLNGPSESLKQRVLMSARLAWSERSVEAVYQKSLIPYFAAMAATLLFILTIDAIGCQALKPWQSKHTLIVRQDATRAQGEIDDDLSPRPQFILYISNLTVSQPGAYRSQLHTLLAEGYPL